MPRSKHNRLRGLEPEGPEESTPRPRIQRAPVAPAKIDLDAILGRALGTVILGIVERAGEREPDAARAAKRCTRCSGTMSAPSAWVYCPLCGGTMVMAS